MYVNGKEVTEITIPATVSQIGSYSFYNCRFITSVNIPSSVNSIGIYTFAGCASLESINLPESITSIGKKAFYGSGLTSLHIPKSVNTIDESAFNLCRNLTNVTIDATANIPENAFINCSNLTTVTIGKSVPSIGYEAFAHCNNLEVIYCLSTTPPDAHSTSFNESYPEYMTLHVPAGTKHLYETAEVWKDFGAIIEDDEELMGIDEVGADMTQEIDYSSPYDVYNMQGIRVGATTKGLVPGMYIVRQGATTAKIAIN